MAMVNTTRFEDHSILPFKDSDVEAKADEYAAIQGKMITVSFTSNHMEKEVFKSNSVTDYQNYIKDKLAMELARYMIREKLIHFSLIEDIASGGTEYRARCFATPDNQTRLILNTKKR
jgi:hypothetical protein